MFFVTFRLEGSIPRIELENWEHEYKQKVIELSRITDEKKRNLALFNHRKISFSAYDSLMEDIDNGPYYLREAKIMNIVKDQLHRFDGELYDLVAYCIMSNHVHLLVDTSQNLVGELLETNIYDNHSELSYILKRIKGPSAKYANQELGLSGRFWNKENYDIYNRNEKMLNKVIGYILDNPVKAGLVSTWENYAGNYLMA
ncbi:MAG: REP element-mobilizing transposase RayT [Halioglobus sp.]|jgi:REP element-mobilizing transposase RayT